MLNLTRPDFKKIKAKLLKQQKTVEEDIKSLEKSDPVLASAVAESSEPGTDSWMADVHGRAVAIKQSLQSILFRIKKSLEQLKRGQYGKCDNCGKMIEQGRLEVMPAANLCISCSKKSPKR